MQGAPPAACDTLLAALQPSTLATYSPGLRHWWNFCMKHSKPLFSPSVEEVLLFLSQQFDRNIAFSTLNGVKAAIAQIIPPDIINSAIIQRFCRGAANRRPPEPKYDHTWDPGMVLSFFKSMPPSAELLLPDLSKKVVTLLALCTGHRMQTLGSIILPNIHASETGYEIFISSRLKTSKHLRTQPTLSLPFFELPAVCPATALRLYLSRTASLRGSTESLFISPYPPFAPVSTQTLTRWVRCILKNSGVEDTFSAHSTRHASTSAAHRAGIPLDEIRKTAGWTSTSSTFANFYNRPLRSPTHFAAAVLQS